MTATPSNTIVQQFNDLCLNHGGVFAAVIAGSSGANLAMPGGTKGTTASAEVFFKLLDAHTLPAPGTEGLQVHRRDGAAAEAKPLSSHMHRRGNYRGMKGQTGADAAEARALKIPAQNINLAPLSRAFAHHSRQKFDV